MPSLKTARINRPFAVNLAKRRNWYAEAEAAATTDETTQTTETPSKSEAKFTQADIDKIAGNRAKEAASAAVKKILKDLGMNPDDDKAVELIKGKLSLADEAEKAKLSAEERANLRIAELEKERDAEKAARAELETASRLKLRDEKIVKALTDARAKDAGDLLILMSVKKPELIKAIMKDDGVIDEGALKKFVDAAKVDYKGSFVGTSPSIPSNQGGRNPDGKADFGERSLVRF